MEDLTGRTFGRLIVLGLETKNGKQVWKCECTCKKENRNIVYVTNDHLKSGHTKSCGCLAIETRRKNGERRKADLTGERFGRLVALKITPDIKTKSPTWECICDCGKTCFTTAANLRAGQVRSCGCLMEEVRKKTAAVTWERELKSHFISGTVSDFVFDPGRIKSNNVTGYPGVEHRKRDGKWIAVFKLCGQKYWLGSYYTKEEAILARMEAEDKIISEFLEYLKENRPDEYEQFENLRNDSKNETREKIKQRAITKLKKADLSEKKFGKLTVLRDIGEYRNDNTSSKIWECKCECGNVVYYTTKELKNEKYLSCNENNIHCTEKIDYENVKGVTWDKEKNKWLAAIGVNRKNLFLCRSKNHNYAKYIATSARRHRKNGDFQEWYDKLKEK